MATVVLRVFKSSSITNHINRIFRRGERGGKSGVCGFSTSYCWVSWRCYGVMHHCPNRYADTWVCSKKNFHAYFPGWHLLHFLLCLSLDVWLCLTEDIEGRIYPRYAECQLYTFETVQIKLVFVKAFKGQITTTSPKPVRRGYAGQDEDSWFEGNKFKALASW